MLQEIVQEKLGPEVLGDKKKTTSLGHSKMRVRKFKGF